jgi:hypothetical protein
VKALYLTSNAYRQQGGEVMRYAMEDGYTSVGVVVGVRVKNRIDSEGDRLISSREEGWENDGDMFGELRAGGGVKGEMKDLVKEHHSDLKVQ